MADVSIKMDSIQKITKGLGFGAYGKVQKFIDTTIAEGMDDYVPKDTGALKNSVNKSRFGSGRLVYDTPYAKTMYRFGKKEGTATNGMHRGRSWAERYWRDNKRSVLEAIQREIRRIG